MLYLTRKVGESVIIDGDIEVTVMEVRGRSVRLGFVFPTGTSVLRRELFERIEEENRAAAEGAAALLDTLAAAPPGGSLPPTDAETLEESAPAAKPAGD